MRGFQILPLKGKNIQIFPINCIFIFCSITKLLQILTATIWQHSLTCTGLKTVPLLPWTVMFGLCISTFTWIRLESSKATTRLPLKARDQSSWVEKSHQKYLKLDPFISWNQISTFIRNYLIIPVIQRDLSGNLEQKKSFEKNEKRERERARKELSHQPSSYLNGVWITLDVLSVRRR